MNGTAILTLEQLKLALDGCNHGPMCHCLECDGDGCPRTHDEACDCGAWRAQGILSRGIDEAERTDPLYGWVKVSERLPEAEIPVLVAGVDSRGVALSVAHITKYRTGLVWMDVHGSQHSGLRITHWREIGPLPEPDPASSHDTDATEVKQ